MQVKIKVVPVPGKFVSSCMSNTKFALPWLTYDKKWTYIEITKHFFSFWGGIGDSPCISFGEIKGFFLSFSILEIYQIKLSKIVGSVHLLTDHKRKIALCFTRVSCGVSCWSLRWESPTNHSQLNHPLIGFHAHAMNMLNDSQYFNSIKQFFILLRDLFIIFIYRNLKHWPALKQETIPRRFGQLLDDAWVILKVEWATCRLWTTGLLVESWNGWFWNGGPHLFSTWGVTDTINKNSTLSMLNVE